MPSKPTHSEPLPIKQQEMKDNKVDELMKWLRLVLKHTKFSRLLPVLSECLTMEQTDMLISAKAKMILEKQENVQNDFKKEEKIKRVQAYGFDGESDIEVQEEVVNSGDEVSNVHNKGHCNYSEEVNDHMNLQLDEENEVNNGDINYQPNDLDETPVKIKLRASSESRQSAAWTKGKKMGRPRTWTSLDCKECDMAFDTYTKKKYHMSSIHSSRTFKCLECHQHFSSSTSLKRHGLVHQDFRPFSCTVCNKTMKRKTQLAEHMRTHTGEKPFTCPECPYRGSSSSLLAHHKRNNHKGGIKMLL